MLHFEPMTYASLQCHELTGWNGLQLANVASRFSSIAGSLFRRFQPPAPNREHGRSHRTGKGRIQRPRDKEGRHQARNKAWEHHEASDEEYSDGARWIPPPQLATFRVVLLGVVMAGHFVPCVINSVSRMMR